MGASDHPLRPWIPPLLAVALLGAVLTAVFVLGGGPRAQAPSQATPGAVAPRSPGSPAAPNAPGARPQAEPPDGLEPEPGAGDLAALPTGRSERAVHKAEPAVPDWSDTIARAAPAIVTVLASRGSGSAFFVAPGRLLTNAHVADGSAVVTVRTRDGRQWPARVAGRAANADLAVLHCDAAPQAQPTLDLRPFREVRVGEEVVAIGSPVDARLDTTVTRGIVSAVRAIDDVVFLQTDAALNPGNSGGPLVDRLGRVVGINTWKVVRAEAIGFSIAADHGLALLEGRPLSARTLAGGAQAQVGPAVMMRPVEPAGPSGAEASREGGEREFKARVAAIAREAQRVAGLAEVYRDRCAAAESRPECLNLRGEIQGLRTTVRHGITEAEERARRAGVYPGVLRDIRRAHGMDWPGWDR